MNQKLVTVLFVSVFCYGVTYSSPLNLQNEGMGLPEEKPPTDPRPTTEQINKKVETSSVVISPLNQNVTSSKTLNPSSQTVKDVAHPIPTLNTTEPHQRPSEEASNENTKNQTISSGKTSSESTANTSVPTSSVSPAALPTAASTVAKSTAGVPAPPTDTTKNNSTNASANKIPTNTTSHESSSTSTTTTTTTTTSTTTTTTTTTMKPSITTTTPISANKDNVVEHNTPAPVQEKHFDGQSFIGGMALTIGLTAIGFIAFKYYKSGKIDMNYRAF